MNHRTIASLLFISSISACSSKENDDTAGLAAEQAAPAGLNSSDDGEPQGEEEEEVQEQDAEELDDGSEGDDRDRNDETSDEDADSSESAQGGTLSEGAGAEEGGVEEGGAGTVDGVVMIEAADLPMMLPPSGTSGTLTSYSATAPSGLIRDLDVKIDLDHSCSKDLAATLTSPSGTTVVLFDLRGLVVCSSDMEDTLLDDEASTLISRGATPFSGLHRPTGFLSEFDGEDAAGRWTLVIVDDTVGDKGTLNHWSMSLSID